MAMLFAKAGVPVSPIKLDNTIFGYTGGMDRAVTEAMIPLLRTGPEPPAGGMTDIPGLRAFAVRFPSGQAESIQRFYDRLEELGDKANAERLAKRFPGRIEPERLTGAERNELALLRLSERRMQPINTEIRRITSSTMTPEAKRKEIDRLYRMMIEDARNVLGIAERIRERAAKK